MCVCFHFYKVSHSEILIFRKACCIRIQLNTRNGTTGKDGTPRFAYIKPSAKLNTAVVFHRGPSVPRLTNIFLKSLKHPPPGFPCSFFSGQSQAELGLQGRVTRGAQDPL